MLLSLAILGFCLALGWYIYTQYALLQHVKLCHSLHRLGWTLVTHSKCSACSAQVRRLGPICTRIVGEETCNCVDNTPSTCPPGGLCAQLHQANQLAFPMWVRLDAQKKHLLATEQGVKTWKELYALKKASL